MYSLAREDITRFEQVEKLNLNTCLTWLTFVKEKNELEQRQIKNVQYFVQYINIVESKKIKKN